MHNHRKDERRVGATISHQNTKRRGGAMRIRRRPKKRVSVTLTKGGTGIIDGRRSHGKD